MTSRVNPMSSAPRDGTTVLLKYKPQLYWAGKYHPTGTKWEECRWMKSDEGSRAHWQPWEGSPKVTSTLEIDEKDCLGWMEIPK